MELLSNFISFSTQAANYGLQQYERVQKTFQPILASESTQVVFRVFPYIAAVVEINALLVEVQESVLQIRDLRYAQQDRDSDEDVVSGVYERPMDTKMVVAILSDSVIIKKIISVTARVAMMTGLFMEAPLCIPVALALKTGLAAGDMLVNPEQRTLVNLAFVMICFGGAWLYKEPIDDLASSLVIDLQQKTVTCLDPVNCFMETNMAPYTTKIAKMVSF